LLIALTVAMVAIAVNSFDALTTQLHNAPKSSYYGSNEPKSRTVSGLRYSHLRWQSSRR
jgi:hypothetical protein